MKITLKLSAKQLSVLVYLLQQNDQPNNANKEERFFWSILNELKLKIEKKHLEINSGLTLFNSKQKHNLRFNFYQAYIIEQYLIICSRQPLNDYDGNVLKFIYSTINKQLA